MIRRGSLINMRRITKSRLYRFQRGLTIEYAMVMIVLVAAFIVAILTTVTTTSREVKSYRNYAERKMFADELGRCFIENRTQNADHDLAAEFGDNDMGITWTEEGQTLIVRYGPTIVLLVELERADGEWKVVTYRYGVL